MDGDVALVKLSRKAKLNRFVQTVCLPDENGGDLAIPKTKGIVAGWGITRALTSTQLEEVTTEDFSNVLRNSAGLVIVSIFFMANWKGIVYQGLLLQQNNIYLSIYVTVVTVGCLKYLQLTRVKQPITTLQM